MPLCLPLPHSGEGDLNLEILRDTSLLCFVPKSQTQSSHPISSAGWSSEDIFDSQTYEMNSCLRFCTLRTTLLCLFHLIYRGKWEENVQLAIAVTVAASLALNHYYCYHQPRT